MSAIRGRSIIKFTRCLRGKNDSERRKEEEQGLSEEGVACLPNLAPDWLRPLVAVRDHPVLTTWSEQLRAVGTATKVALTGCIRTLLSILNAMVQHHTPRPPQEVPSASPGPLDTQDSCSAPALLRLPAAAHRGRWV
jgi:hypothetical protein